MQNKFTQKAQNTLKAALAEAGKLGHPYLGTEHILLALITQNDSVASRILLSRGLSAVIVRTALSELVGIGEPCQPSVSDLTTNAKNILESSAALAEEHSCNYIGTEHLLLAMLLCEKCTAYKIIKRSSLSPSQLIYDISSHNASVLPIKANTDAGTSEQKKKTVPSVLSRYSRDLCELAQRGALDTLVGRNEELERACAILCRRKKNNPCLIGEPGVGKTAIVEGLAQKIVDGNVPELLKNCRIISLDICAMLAGAKYRGEFEDRMKSVLNEVDKHPEIILFIDELHVIVGAGSAEGAVDAGNILKPSLARGGIRVIGATTLDEYKKHIERDSALCRRFGAVNIEEPSETETLELLRGIRSSYELHHGIGISDEAISSAVKLSVRYINDRFLPDKAIDLIDEAAASLKLSPSDDNTEQVLTEWHIANAVSRISGIPRDKILGKENTLSDLEAKLKKRIIGQDEAIAAVCSAIRRGSIGLSSTKRPTGVFLFSGKPGVGKTALAYAVAEELFGSSKALLKFDMSEYMEPHSISKLIGSPPGYVGYGDGGLLTDGVHRRPYCVVLFDEIEKAHPDIFNILLPIMEEGELCDSKGRRVSFCNTVIIITSNEGVRSAESTAGFSDISEKERQTNKNILSALKNKFSPEFLSRIDETVVFNTLTETSLSEIAAQMLKELADRAEDIGIDLTFSDDVKNEIARLAYKESNGARGVRQIIAKQLEDMLAEKIVHGELQGTATVYLDNQKFEIQ